MRNFLWNAFAEVVAKIWSRVARCWKLEDRGPLASMNGRYDDVEYLLKQCADPTRRGAMNLLQQEEGSARDRDSERVNVNPRGIVLQDTIVMTNSTSRYDDTFSSRETLS